jgi:protease IV
MAQKNFFSYVFGGAWRLWDLLCRLVINAVITLIVVVLLVAGFSSRHIIVPSSAALVVDMQGDLVEQFSGDPGQRALGRLLGQKQQPQVRLRDVVDAVEHAKDDDRIKALVLETDGMQSAGLVDLQDVAQAVRDFRKSGKPVFAAGDGYSQEQYYLASTAGTVFIHPQGQVFLRGFGIYEPYFKDALDKLGVEVNVFRVGKYKSAVEPFMLNGMSPEARENYTTLLNQLWADYSRDVTRERKLPPDALDAYIKSLDTNLAAVGGDGARLALKQKLVDKIATDDQMAAAVQKVVGEYRHSFRQVGYQDYLNAVEVESASAVRDGDKVGVIVAEGDIKDGDQPPGVIGGDSTAELIRNARYDDAVKAVVLRVDSPGGSSFASDVILREIELTKEAGKPVVVSMGNLAASGGYWISMAGDQIYASPATITGSIGIFGMLPTFQNSLAKIGITTDGVGTSPLSDALDLTRAMSPQVKEAFQLFINHGYDEFITKVAKNRHMKVPEVDAIAQGRVWSGEDGKRIGIVDRFGNLQDAVAEAAKLADLGKRYQVQYIEKPMSLYDRMLIGLASDSGDEDSRLALLGKDALSPWYQRALKVADLLKVFDDPRGSYAYCFCDVR